MMFYAVPAWFSLCHEAEKWINKLHALLKMMENGSANPIWPIRGAVQAAPLKRLTLLLL